MISIKRPSGVKNTERDDNEYVGSVYGVPAANPDKGSGSSSN